MRVKFSYLTNRGRVRDRNEDSLLILKEVVSGTSMDAPQIREVELDRGIFAVADGMGGLPCGEKASALVLERLRVRFANSCEEVGLLLRECKAELDSFVKRTGRCAGMGTAIAGIFLHSGGCVVFNVGDCRVYRLRERIERLTRDHTEAYELYERGYIDEEELRSHPYRNILTSALLGIPGEGFELHCTQTDVLVGDTYLVCSDGLWEVFSQEELSLIMGMDIEEAGRFLFRKSYLEGRDNVSFIIFRVLSAE